MSTLQGRTIIPTKASPEYRNKIIKEITCLFPQELLGSEDQGQNQKSCGIIYV